MLRKLFPNVLRVVYWRQMAGEFALIWHIVRDRRVPLYLKAIPALAALYLLLPVDLVPDWIPVLGQIDDLAILALAVRLFVRLAPADVVATYQARLGSQMQMQA
jgi:uncharacterized membrane protein YkvA (DUF1232 family)